jgi:hypothetical protein
MPALSKELRSEYSADGIFAFDGNIKPVVAGISVSGGI